MLWTTVNARASVRAASQWRGRRGGGEEEEERADLEQLGLRVPEVELDLVHGGLHSERVGGEVLDPVVRKKKARKGKRGGLAFWLICLTRARGGTGLLMLKLRRPVGSANGGGSGSERKRGAEEWREGKTDARTC